MKMKPSYKPNNAKYCKTCRNKNIDKVTKRDKNKKQFTKEDPKYCDTEKYEEQKSKDRERKRMAKEGRKKRLQQHQWTKVKNPPMHHHQHSKHKQAKSRYLKKNR